MTQIQDHRPHLNPILIFHFFTPPHSSSSSRLYDIEAFWIFDQEILSRFNCSLLDFNMSNIMPTAPPSSNAHNSIRHREDLLRMKNLLQSKDTTSSPPLLVTSKASFHMIRVAHTLQAQRSPTEVLDLLSHRDTPSSSPSLHHVSASSSSSCKYNIVKKSCCLAYS